MPVTASKNEMFKAKEKLIWVMNIEKTRAPFKAKEKLTVNDEQRIHEISQATVKHSKPSSVRTVSGTMCKLKAEEDYEWDNMRPRRADLTDVKLT
ncbi:hypothetical protein E2C01_053220 [Portunus trituberculatus]|uniref:Uncharacterized protein n=1 Tax=Portunus trituberculatus TaxID=210409 RepID=A0A5B7GRF3_PORTR|nr:hypothetical protein [Portunus trituberculatus]